MIPADRRVQSLKHMPPVDVVARVKALRRADSTAQVAAPRAADDPHGRASTFDLGCRCRPCRDAFDSEPFWRRLARAVGAA